MKAGMYWVRTEDIAAHEDMLPAHVVYNDNWAINPKVFVLGYSDPFSIDQITEFGPELLGVNQVRLMTSMDVEQAKALIVELGSVCFHGAVPVISVLALWNAAAVMMTQYTKMRVRAEAAEMAIEQAIDASDNGGGSASDAIQDMLGILRGNDDEDGG